MYSINKDRCVCTFSVPLILHNPSFYCSLLLIHICELLLLNSYSFSVSLLCTFSFLATCNPPSLPVRPPCLCVLVLLYTTIVLVQCTLILIIILYLRLSSSSCPVYHPFFVSQHSFSCSSSHRVLFFSLVFFYVFVRPNFSGVHRNFTAVHLYYSVGQIFRTCPLRQFPTAFCRFAM